MHVTEKITHSVCQIVHIFATFHARSITQYYRLGRQVNTVLKSHGVALLKKRPEHCHLCASSTHASLSAVLCSPQKDGFKNITELKQNHAYRVHNLICYSCRILNLLQAKMFFQSYSALHAVHSRRNSHSCNPVARFPNCSFLQGATFWIGANPSLNL